jgi:DNA repair exonuclease SbcCD nuclease subunit
MKILATGDWHADWSTYGVSRYGDVKKAVDETIHVALQERIDFYVFLGDLSNPEDGPAALRSVSLIMDASIRCTRVNKIEFVAISGNHDVIEDGSGDTVLSPIGMLPSVRLYESPTCQIFDHVLFERTTVRVIALPFTASSHGYDPEEFVDRAVQDDPREVDATIVLSHLTGLQGVQPGEETTEMPRGREVRFPAEAIGRIPGRKVVLQGHFHRRQTWRPVGQDYDVHIIGSLARLTFGEEKNDPGYTMVEIP